MTIEEFHNILDNGPVYTKKTIHHGDPEHQLQVQCVKWFRLKYKNVLLWANGNGGKRDAVTGAKMKAEGVLAGLPDLTIAKASKGFHGLYIEMKNGKKNNPTDAQKDFMSRLNEEGYKAVVCRSFDEFVQIVTEYLE